MSEPTEIHIGRHECNAPRTFTDIFDAYRLPIHYYLLRLTQDPVVAEDLTQETFMRVHAGLPGFRGEASLATWVYRIASNVCLDHLRRRSTTQDSVTHSLDEVSMEHEMLVDDEAASPERQAVRSEMSACVQAHIDQLPPDYRAALILHDLEGMTSAEIADMLAVSLDTVKIRLHRARARLRAALKMGCDFAHDERSVLVCEPKAGIRAVE